MCRQKLICSTNAREKPIKEKCKKTSDCENLVKDAYLFALFATFFTLIFPTIDSLPASGLTPRLYDWSVSSEHLGFYF